ncbi:MAG: hypothetical protein HXX17_06830 [Geobacteraceae bacterium]|nr:hypothetical protein [Geobacteraceae bacterium]
MTDAEDQESRRPLGITLLTGLYFFFFLLSITTYGHPFPFLGSIYQGTSAKALVFFDSLICIYLLIGIFKRQELTWYLLLCYNLFEIVNTIINLTFIKPKEIARIIGSSVDQGALAINNIAAALAILLLSQFIYRNRKYFNNTDRFLF